MKLSLFDLLAFFIFLFFGLFLSVNFVLHFNNPYQHFTIQATSFLNGKLDLSINKFLNNEDFVIYNGKYYWHQGPFPSILLLPFIFLFGPSFNQSMMQLFLVPILLLILYKLARIKQFSKNSSLYLIAVFIFGSPMIGLIGNSHTAEFAQTVTTTFLSLLLLEYLTRKRPIILGLLNGIILTTRPTAGFIILLILFRLLRSKNHRLKNVVLFTSPVVIAILFLLFFNFFRFGNALNNGYTINNLNPILTGFRQSGIFNIINLPGNFFFYFLAPPFLKINQNHLLIYPFIIYSPWGLSFFIVAPFFIYALKAIKISQNLPRELLAICGITMLVLLTYFASGWIEFGPRYTVDFLPLLYLCLLYSIQSPNLTKFQKILILFSSFLNMYLYTNGFLIS